MDRASNPRTIVVAAILCALTFAVFWPALRSDFIKLDDGFYVVHNPQVTGGVTPANVIWAFSTGYQGNWHPVTWISHMLDAQLFGLKPGWHHLTNLLLHAANSVLLFLLLLRLTTAFWRSAFVAALFALHPLRVESVAWISERKDVLSAFFFFLTLLTYAKHVAGREKVKTPASDSGDPVSRSTNAVRRINWYTASLICFALGLMSKPMLVTVPFLLLLLDCWPLRRIEPADIFNFQILVPLLREKVPFFILTVVSSIVTFLVQSASHATTYLHLPLTTRLANAVASCLKYLGKTIWPVNLAVYYPHPALPYRHGDLWPAWLTCAAAALLAVISVLALTGWKRRPWLTTGWFWYLGMLVPVIGIVQVGGQGMADRYTYLPLAGIFICVAWGAVECCGGKNFCRAVLSILAVGTLTASAIATHRQVQYWQNNAILFEHTLAVTGTNPVAEYHVAHSLHEKGEDAAAMAKLQAATVLDPSLGVAYAEMGDMLESSGKSNEAIAQYETALSVNPETAWIHNHLGVLFWRMGRQDEALKHYEAAIRLEPDNADAHYNLGVALLDRGDYANAAVHFAAGARLRPDDADVRVSFAEAAQKAERFDQAEVALLQAVQISPTNAQAQESLALFLARQDRLGEAVPHFQQAVKLKPDWPDALNNLAWVEATRLNNGPEAVRLAERACELTGGKEARFWGTLDTAYAAAGRIEDAIRTAEKARDLALDAGQKDLAEAAAARLTSYRSRLASPK